jgi:hypothetical protein
MLSRLGMLVFIVLPSRWEWRWLLSLPSVGRSSTSSHEGPSCGSRLAPIVMRNSRSGGVRTLTAPERAASNGGTGSSLAAFCGHDISPKEQARFVTGGSQSQAESALSTSELSRHQTSNRPRLLL